MTKKYSTRKAIVASLIVLALCFTSFLATTFAWFTDSVKSENNVIMSGNLDIELEYWNGEKWEDVAGKSDIITNTLWEPGVVEVAYLRVANAGSLALKYQLGINIDSETPGVNVAGEEFLLSDYIMFGVVEDVNGKTGAYDNRNDAVQAATGAKKISAGYTKASHLAVDEELYLALVVYMPESVDNVANHNGTDVPTIELGINVFATQASAEKDSFDEFYDVNSASFTTEEANALLLQNKDVTLINCNEPNGVLYVPADYTGTLTLSNVTLASVQQLDSASTFAARATTTTTTTNIVILGDVTIIATENGMSAITAKALNITGDGILYAKGKGTAAFGIGGLETESITIDGVAISYVEGGHAYGVGSDTKYYKDAPEGGAAIGSGFDGAVITLKNVTIGKAIGGSKAAAIGARYHTGVEVNINNSTINYAEGGVSAAAIGGSRISNGATESGTIINITGSTVTAKGGAYGAGIGSGYDTHCQSAQPLCTINIANSDITATGGQYAAGVGTGYHHAALAGEIKNSTVNATSGDKYYKDTYTGAQDIGFGVTDPAREGKQTDSAIIYNGEKIAITEAPVYVKLADGFFHAASLNTYFIYSAEGLFAFAESVNKYSNYEYPYEGETVLLMNDVDLEGAEWIPIGDYRFSANRFCGIFDGQGYTISNFKITKKTDKNDSNKSSYGFFGNVEGTVKNLTVADASVSSYAYCGALVGRLNSGLVENCHVVNCDVAPSYWQGGIMIGQVNGGAVKNCTVSNSTITGKSALGGMFGPVTAESGDILFENCSVKDSAINQSGSFGGNYDKYFGGLFGYLESGDNRIDVNGCTVTNTTIKGEASSVLSGDNDGNIYFNGIKGVSTAEELEAAVKAGGTVVLAGDITLAKDIAISNANFVLDGNGYTITGNSTYGLFDITRGTVAVKNVTFDGVNGPVIRTVDVKLDATNVVVANCNSTQQQGLFRLMGENTIDSCVFENNVCSMAITLNYDGANNQPQIVKNCVFEGNTCNGTAVLYYVKGASCTLTDNEFISNTVNCNTNGATVYMGFTENNVVTGNLFKDNTVTDSSTSTRVSGGIFFGYETVFENNSFINNKATNANGDALGNNVCVSTYYTDIDLSGNYWGGNAPVEGEDYFVQHKTSGYVVIIDDYLPSI